MDRRSLFVASCFALVVTSLSFGIRAGILNDLQGQFALTDSQISTIAATAFWGFPISMVIGGMLVDRLGMKPLMYLAFLMHLGGILLTIFANGYLTLFLSTLMIGLGNGMVEAVCNPLVASIYPENKTTKLNHFHLWFPGGIVLGTLISFVFTNMDWGWQAQMGTMLLPLAIYGYLFSKAEFPVTERVKSGVSEADMYKNLFQPLFLFMMICMLGTSITELFTGQYIDVLLHSVSENAILILFISSGVMTLGRGLAEGVVKTLKPLLACHAGWRNALHERCGLWLGRDLLLAHHDWLCRGELAQHGGRRPFGHGRCGHVCGFPVHASYGRLLRRTCGGYERRGSGPHGSSHHALLTGRFERCFCRSLHVHAKAQRGLNAWIAVKPSKPSREPAPPWRRLLC
jgi:MFS family permease